MRWNAFVICYNTLPINCKELGWWCGPSGCFCGLWVHYQTQNNIEEEEEEEEGLTFGLRFRFTHECATTIKGEEPLNDGNLWVSLSFYSMYACSDYKRCN